MALDRCSDDPRLPYRLGTEQELTDVVAHAQALAGGDASILPMIADAASSEEMSQAIETAERSFGGLDAVIAIAGVIAGGVPLWEMPVREQDAVLDANLKSVLVASRAGIPALLRRPVPRAGRFVAVASAAATRGLPMLAVYCAAKAGVHRAHPRTGGRATRLRCDRECRQPWLHGNAGPRRERPTVWLGVSGGLFVAATDLAPHPPR
jgi:NAD(P)-dependent dehydrogenase (short-subunit alcohol dehydrogenase family)